MIDSIRTWWRSPLRCALLVFFVLGSRGAEAQLQVDITSGVSVPIPLAIEDFAADPQASAEVIRQDLARSGRFIVGLRTAADYLVTGRASAGVDGRTTIDFELLNLLNGQRLLVERVTSPPTAWRNAAHRISDRIYQKIIGARSAFATRIAYVSVDGQPPSQRYQLIVADADGENARVVLQSRLPLMSPTWSPDGESIAYVSFETRAAAIYVQKVRTAERRRVSGRPGSTTRRLGRPTGVNSRSRCPRAAAISMCTCLSSTPECSRVLPITRPSIPSPCGRSMAAKSISPPIAPAGRRFIGPSRLPARDRSASLLSVIIMRGRE